MAPRAVPGGYTGVDAFFVLSGYLITTLLHREYQRTGTIDIRAFWERRLVRLTPALLVVTAAAVLISVLYRVRAAEGTSAAVPWVLLNVGNYARALNHDGLGLLGHTWSLAIEAQYYLVWPLLLGLVLRRGRTSAWRVVGALAVADVVWQWAVCGHVGEARAYFATDTHAFPLLAGSALALCGAARDEGAEAKRGSALLQLVMLGSFALVLFSITETPASMTGQLAVTSVCTLGVLSLLARRVKSPVVTVLCHPWLRSLGLRSYGCYLWHYPIVGVLRPHDVLSSVTDVVVIILLAEASWRFVELPAQNRWGVHARSPNAPRFSEDSAKPLAAVSR